MESNETAVTCFALAEIAGFARTLNGDRVLFRLRRDDADPPAADIELDDPIGQREERVVAAYADVAAWMKLRAALADDNAAGADGLAAVCFDA
jgi:hypothetical protein